MVRKQDLPLEMFCVRSDFLGRFFGGAALLLFFTS